MTADQILFILSNCENLSRWGVEKLLYRLPHFSFQVHLVICAVQECHGSQCLAGKRHSLQGYRRVENVASDPGADKWDPLPLTPRLCEPQQIKHPGLVKEDSANNEIERALAEELLRLRHRVRATELMPRKDPFKDCAWLWRRRYQDLS